MFVSSNLPEDLKIKVDKLLGDFEKTFRETVEKEKLNPVLFPIFRNHNLFLGVDTTNVHIVYTTEGVTSGIVSATERDLRALGNWTREQIASACVNELGFKDVHYFSFPARLLYADEESRSRSFERVIRQYVKERIRSLVLLNNLGLNEALAYLQNARSRFETRTPSGYSDCKANCRNALISALKALSGTENVREAVKRLAKKDIIGERERELIKSFENLLVKLIGMLSKKGPHPPCLGKKKLNLL